MNACFMLYFLIINGLGQEPYLSYHVLQTSKPSRVGHGVLVLPPLLVTVAFCYAFVLMQPHATKNQSAAASQPVGLTDIEDGLPSLDIASPSSLPTLTTIEQDIPAGTAATDIATGTPQPGTNGVNALQSTVASDGQTITVPVAAHRARTSSVINKSAPTKQPTSPSFLHNLLHKL